MLRITVSAFGENAVFMRFGSALKRLRARETAVSLRNGIRPGGWFGVNIRIIPRVRAVVICLSAFDLLLDNAPLFVKLILVKLRKMLCDRTQKKRDEYDQDVQHSHKIGKVIENRAYNAKYAGKYPDYQGNIAEKLVVVPLDSL